MVGSACSGCDSVAMATQGSGPVCEAEKGQLLKVLGGERHLGLRPGREFKVYKSFLQDGGRRKFLKTGGITLG